MSCEFDDELEDEILSFGTESVDGADGADEG
jgi:hypothetical protein